MFDNKEKTDGNNSDGEGKGEYFNPEEEVKDSQWQAKVNNKIII